MLGWNFPNLPGITAVLNGHNHNMQRLEVPRGGAGVGTGTSSTVPFMISGAGGNSLYSISGTAQFNAFFNTSDFGFLLVDANDSGITFRFINSAGTVLDTRFIAGPPTPGACCTGTTCQIVASTMACAGQFQGVSSVCGVTGNPTTCCTANFDGTNGVDVQDIFAFLSAWFAKLPTADVSAPSSIDVNDIFTFLALWFAKC